MTKWQKQIDGELGTERKFTQELEARIIERTTKKRRTNWQVGTAFVGLVVVLFFLVLVGPAHNEVQVQTTAPFEEIIQMTDVKAFYVSNFPTGKEHFTARDSSLYIGTKRYHDTEDARFMQKVLESMVLVEDVKSYGVERDVLVEMEDGQQLKLKFYDYGSWLGVKDLQSKLFYMVEDRDILLEFRADYIKGMTPLMISLMGLLIALINVVWSYVSSKIFGLKQKKLSEENIWFFLLKGVAIFIFLVPLIYAFFGTVIVHKAVLLGGAILFFGLDIVAEKIFEPNQQYVKFLIIRDLVALIGVIILILFM